MKDFSYWKKRYESEHLEEFSTDIVGLLWLKIKSINRRELLNEFANQNKLQLKEKSLSNQFIELFNFLSLNPKNSHKLLNYYLIEKSKTQLEILDTE